MSWSHTASRSPKPMRTGESPRRRRWSCLVRAPTGSSWCLPRPRCGHLDRQFPAEPAPARHAHCRAAANSCRRSAGRSADYRSVTTDVRREAGPHAASSPRTSPVTPAEINHDEGAASGPARRPLHGKRAAFSVSGDHSVPLRQSRCRARATSSRRTRPDCLGVARSRGSDHPHRGHLVLGHQRASVHQC